MRHLSAFVQPGARFVPASSFTGYENQLAFVNPDSSVAILIKSEMTTQLPVKAKLGNKTLSMDLAPGSYNTLVLPKASYS